MTISDDDRKVIGEAIRAAEARTSGEIVCVMARASSNYAHIPIIWAAFLALATPWPLIMFTRWSVQWIFLTQLLVFAVAALGLSLPRLRMLLVPGPMRRARAHNAAMQQFLARGLTRTRERSGVLIFVSLAERYARIVADEGIAAKVPAAAWRDAVRGLVDEVRVGNIGAGFAHAVARCADVLGEHFPRRDDDRNELPDRIYVI